MRYYDKLVFELSKPGRPGFSLSCEWADASLGLDAVFVQDNRSFSAQRGQICVLCVAAECFQDLEKDQALFITCFLLESFLVLNQVLPHIA